MMDEPRASTAPHQAANRSVATRRASAEIAIKEFAILEWMWVTYVIFCLLFYWLLHWQRGYYIEVALQVAFYIVEFPLSLWVIGWQFEELVPPWMRIYFAFLTAAVNGGLYYVLARVFFRPWRSRAAGPVKG